MSNHKIVFAKVIKRDDIRKSQVDLIRANAYFSFVMVFGLLAHQKHKPKEIE